jgi:hypothetical protein
MADFLFNAIIRNISLLYDDFSICFSFNTVNEKSSCKSDRQNHLAIAGDRDAKARDKKLPPLE